MAKHLRCDGPQCTAEVPYGEGKTGWFYVDVQQDASVMASPIGHKTSLHFHAPSCMITWFEEMGGRSRA